MNAIKLSLSERVICLSFAVSLVFTSRSLELLGLPLYYFFEIGVLGIILFILLLAVVSNMSSGWGKINNKVLITALLIIIMNVTAALMSYINYGQGFIVGLLTFRIPFISAIIYLIYYMLFSKKIFEKKHTYFSLLINSIFIVSLVLTCLWVYLTHTLNAEYYYLTAGNLLVDTRSDGSYRFRFDIFFPFMLFCCSWFKVQQSKNKKALFYYMTGAFALFYIVFYYQGRVFLVALCLSMVLCNIRSVIYSLRHVIIYSVIFMFFILSIIVYFAYDSLIDLYKALLDTFSLTDGSSLTRLKILSIMAKNFIDNFVFGNGYLSNQSNASFGSIKFSPLDMGVLGVLYTYGVILLIVSLGWYCQLWLNSFNKSYVKLYAFAFSTLFINTLFTGGLFFRPYQIMFLLLISFIFNQYDKTNKLRN